MKQQQNRFYRPILLIFAILLVIHTVKESHGLGEGNRGRELKKMEEDSFSNLMELENCETKNEECMKRRMMDEAHLDYIYTQHHKP